MRCGKMKQHFKERMCYGTHSQKRVKSDCAIKEFFLNSPLFSTFFGNIAPVIYGVNTKIISRGKVIPSCLEDCTTMLHFFI